MMSRSIFVLYLNILCTIDLSDSRNCDGGCCDGYKWDPSTKTCIECKPGFHGTNCSIICNYPQYGYGCQQLCMCEEEVCNIAYGCFLSTAADKTVEFSKSITASTLSISTYIVSNAGFETRTRSVRPRHTAVIPIATTEENHEKQLINGYLYPYVIGSFVLILFLTIAYCGNCSYKRFLSTRTVSNASSGETHAEIRNRDQREPDYDVVNELIHSNNREVNLITYRDINEHHKPHGMMQYKGTSTEIYNAQHACIDHTMQCEMNGMASSANNRDVLNDSENDVNVYLTVI